MQLAACHLACRPAPTVPRHVPLPESERWFLSVQTGVERLKQKLDEANIQNKRDMEAALKSMHWQLQT
jgi:hypothetical protein